jgi:hypothetical protein
MDTSRRSPIAQRTNARGWCPPFTGNNRSQDSKWELKVYSFAIEGQPWGTHGGETCIRDMHCVEEHRTRQLLKKGDQVLIPCSYQDKYVSNSILPIKTSCRMCCQRRGLPHIPRGEQSLKTACPLDRKGTSNITIHRSRRVVFCSHKMPPI